MKKILTVIVACVLAIATLCCFSGCTDKKDGTLKVGVTDYAPMDYKDDNGEWIGFDADLAKEVCKIINYDIEFVEINWELKVTSINAGEIDVIWNGMTITDDLKKDLAITDPYLENKQVLVCQASVASNYTSISDLANASEILVEGGSAGESAVTDAGFETKLTKADAQKDTLLEVKTSSSKVAVIDKLMAEALTGAGTSYTDLTFVDLGFELEQFGIAFRKDDVELKAKIEDAIQQLKDNGKYQELVDKYLI